MGSEKIITSYTPRFLELMREVYPDAIRGNRERRLQVESIMEFARASCA